MGELYHRNGASIALVERAEMPAFASVLSRAMCVKSLQGKSGFALRLRREE